MSVASPSKKTSRDSFGIPGRGLPAENRVEASVPVGLVLVLEIRILHNLPTLHDLRPATEPRGDLRPPVLSPITRRQLPNECAIGAERHRINALLFRMFS